MQGGADSGISWRQKAAEPATYAYERVTDDVHSWARRGRVAAGGDQYGEVG